MVQLTCLMDNAQHLGGSTIEIPNAWQFAVAEGWELVSVIMLANGTRAGYFKRDGNPTIAKAKLPVSPPSIDAPAEQRIQTWFIATFKNKIRLRTGEVCKALGNFGLPQRAHDLKKWADGGVLPAMRRLNGGKHDHWSRDSVITFISENCKEETPCPKT